MATNADRARAAAEFSPATADETAPAQETASTAGAPVMTPEFVRAQCKKHGGYSTEELNEKLYLHHFGFTRVENLEPYTGCRVLFINHNAITDLRPLAALAGLRALYVANNALTSCTMLPLLPSLELLDVSHNYLADLKGVAAAAPQLETLLAAHNRIATLAKDDVSSLVKLSTLDLAHNRLDDDEKLLSALSQAPLRDTLRTVILDGNEVQRRARQLRKRAIAQLPSLRMLDALPVFPEERERAEAFVRGGAAAEADAAAAIRQRQAEERSAQFRFHGAFVAAPRGHRLMNGPRTTSTSYFRDHAHAATVAEGAGDDDAEGNVFVPTSAPAV